MPMKGENMYKVPEGYFEGLKSRLSAIPASETVLAAKNPLWEMAAPIVALAASFAILLVGGTWVLRHTTPEDKSDEADFMKYAYSMIPHTEPYSACDASLAESLGFSVSQDDIIDYLIETGVSMDLIGYESENY